MTGQGHRTFADELARFAAGRGDPRVTAIAERAAAPLRVAVRGRPGVGRGTVARALGRAGIASGISITTDAADVVAYVTAEVVKPEDGAAIAAGRPVVAVLNKADLAGSLSGRAGDGPIAAARQRCAEFSALVGVPMEPMIGLLAVAALDDLDGALWAALRALADDPGGATCLDGSYAGFLAADIPVPTESRLRLLDTLDLFGTALGIAAVRRGGTPAQVRALLRRTSGVDAVLARVCVAGAEVRYRRVLAAVAELEALAVCHDEIAGTIGGFLSRDDTVVARMAAAVDLAEAAGLDPAGLDGDGPDAHLPRAVRWQRYSRERVGPVSDLHRACGADIARGSLRLWSRARASAPGVSR
ncbi:hypothetical protein H7H82_15580 [Mycobacterium heidelbergense]|uniref:Uncharacterized protein n=1 Tax=Mycobacterium heidelbergense TaxID=53376 RepID=A0A1X0DCQ5_MYCHE|nr:hypothetical protein [Mycobacterium heidelbergense]MCV7051997.1 hypothetical protein [Mycobacterium heidelbergense]ORA69959.1 hypothetical protein BST25_20415 [Mycobacterium heidelbergense]BBZ49976.1 hypothetical protein MHEI_16930 [Mycobacterium heidelbergense]